MDKKLIVAVVTLREGGRTVPRYQHAFRSAIRGILTLNETQISALNRHALVATLRDLDSGAAVAGIEPLIDARLIRATSDEWVLTGFERVQIGMHECDCAQTWLVRMEELRSLEHAEG